MTPTPTPGQVWQEVDPRLERFIRVLEITSFGEASIETVERAAPAAGWRRKPGSRKNGGVRLDRFNGKRGGYRYVEEPDDLTGEFSASCGFIPKDAS